jgi:hypothetical protein
VVAVIVCGEDELMGSESLTLPPAEVAFTSYWVVPRGTMIVMLPPSLAMRTLPGTVANSIWTFPPPVPAVTRAVVSAVPPAWRCSATGPGRCRAGRQGLVT